MAIWAFAYLIGSLLLQAAVTPKSAVESAKPAGDGDFDFPTIEEGREWAHLWGTVLVGGPALLWWGDRKEKAIKQDSGGLFSSSSTTTGFKYFIGMQFGFCRGGDYPVDEMRRVFIDDKVVYDGGGDDPVVTNGDTFTIDKPGLFGGDKVGGAGGVKLTMEFFDGRRTQAPSTYLAPFQTEAGQQITYTSRCFIANAEKRGYVGNSPNIAAWKVELRRTPNPLSISSAVVNTLDANPMNVIYEVLTSKDFPLRRPVSEIDIANLKAVGETLLTEGNGFSMIVDRKETADDMITRIQDQVDGVLYRDAIDGVYRFQLARADYDLMTVPEINDDNMVELVEFGRSTLEETSNDVRVGFIDRDDEYKNTFTPSAIDPANIRRRAGERSAIAPKMPGVKDKGLAAKIAWRKLRALSVPLASGSVLVDRSFYATNPGDVLAFTNARLGITRLPIRITRIDLGDLVSGTIRLDFMQDVFYSAEASGSGAQISLWDPPVDVLVGFPVAQQVAFEAPRALLALDPATPDPHVAKICAAARDVGAESFVKIFARTNPSTASFSGTPVEIGEVLGFALIGQLVAALPAGSAYPINSLGVVATPSEEEDILEAFPAAVGEAEAGQGLSTLLLIDDEFMLVSGSVTAPSDISIDGVWRGALDSVQADHLLGANVFALFVGMNISSSSLASGDHVEIRLTPNSQLTELDPLDAGVTAIVLQMSDRAKRPYAPSELSLNGARFGSTVALEGGGGAGEAEGIDVSFLRRDFRSPDEVAQLGADAGTLFADFPAANNTTHEVELINDPDGSPASLMTVDFGSLITNAITALSILKATDGALPTRMEVRIRAVHDFESLAGLESRVDLAWPFDVTSGLTGQFEFGALDNGDISALYTATDAGSHAFTLSTAFSVGDVEFRLNAGSWTTLIAAGGTSGSVAGVVATDTIEIRHLSTDSATEKLLSMNAPASAQDGFAVVFT